MNAIENFENAAYEMAKIERSLLFARRNMHPEEDIYVPDLHTLVEEKKRELEQKALLKSKRLQRKKKKEVKTINFTFSNPESWEYPEGLGEEITRLMEEQGINIVAWDNHGVLYVEPSFQGEHHHCGFWGMTDNGGEIHCWKENTNISFDVPTTSFKGMPSKVEEYALVIIVRMIAGFKGLPMDYDWRPE